MALYLNNISPCLAPSLNKSKKASVCFGTYNCCYKNDKTKKGVHAFYFNEPILKEALKIAHKVLASPVSLGTNKFYYEASRGGIQCCIIHCNSWSQPSGFLNVPHLDNMASQIVLLKGHLK
ncbi:hypothetical protein CFOL_v3_17525, partial [Cephalotus follicularis]